MARQLERLAHCGPRSRCSWIRLSPRSQMLFRPEEVEGRSEGVENSASILSVLSDPHHDGGCPRPWPLRIGREVERRVAVVTSRPDTDALLQHRGDAKRIDGAAGVPFRPVGQPDDKRRRGG